MELYKVLDHDGSARMGVGKWPLPDGKAGEWLEVKGELVACENGLHLCRRDDLVHWLGPAIFMAEYDGGEMLESDDKIVVRRARLIEKLDTWNDRTGCLFAADCAERVLHIFERNYPDDHRPRTAIEVARKVANGDLPVEALTTAAIAARDAAGDAAKAAGDAATAATATAATWAAAAASSARNAAWCAARAAAWADLFAAAGDAAKAAGDAAAWATKVAEQKWQTERLFQILNGEIYATA